MSDGDREPVGTKQWRVTCAIHDHFLTDKDWSEIAEPLGVSERTARSYVHEPPGEEVREILSDQAATVRIASVEELKEQLREAGERKRTAEKPIEVWEEDGYLHVADQRDPETGELVDRYPIPADYELGADEEIRYYARTEIREIIELLTDITGASEPDTIRLEGDVGVEHSGEVENSLSIGFEPTALEEAGELASQPEEDGDG